MPARRATAPLIALAWVVAITAAHADPPRSDSDPCRGRHVGDACEADDFEGTCRSRRCTRETDNGVRTSRCLVCESRRHGHHRRHRDAAPEPDDATGAPSDAAPTDVADDVTPDVAAPRDAGPAVAPRPAPPPPRRSLFACASSPQREDAAGWCALAFALGAALQRRAMGRARSRTGTSL
jgi:hypothetical protein